MTHSRGHTATIIAAILVGCVRGNSVVLSDQVQIYSTVLLDFERSPDKTTQVPRGLLDPKVLEFVDEPASAQSVQITRHTQALVDSLRARGLVVGLCDSAELNGHAACRGDLAGPEYALSPIRWISRDSVLVSLRMNTVCTTRERLCIDFAVEYKYLLGQTGTSWNVARKTQTMIT